MGKRSAQLFSCASFCSSSVIRLSGSFMENLLSVSIQMQEAIHRLNPLQNMECILGTTKTIGLPKRQIKNKAVRIWAEFVHPLFMRYSSHLILPGIEENRHGPSQGRLGFRRALMGTWKKSSSSNSDGLIDLSITSWNGQMGRLWFHGGLECPRAQCSRCRNGMPEG